MYDLLYNAIVYDDLHYLDAVDLEAGRSMLSAVAEVQALPHYAQQGEVISHSSWLLNCTTKFPCSQWVITDARHDSTANAYHTTVPCMTGS